MLTARAPQDLPKKLAMACSSKFIITDPFTFFFDDEVNVVQNFSWNVTNDFPAIKILVLEPKFRLVLFLFWLYYLHLHPTKLFLYIRYILVKKLWL